MGFNVCRTGTYVMDLAFPGDYRGGEEVPGMAVSYDELSLVGFHATFIDKKGFLSFAKGFFDVGCYSIVACIDDWFERGLRNTIVDDYLNEDVDLSNDAFEVIEDWFDNADCFGSVMIGVNRRSMGLTDELLGFVHAMVSIKDFNSFKVTGKYLGVVFENDYTDTTSDVDKYAVGLLRVYPARLVINTYNSYCRRGVVSCDPEDVVRHDGVKPFCLFSRFPG